MTSDLQHLAVIMDGNGRWAESQGLPRMVGHERGAEVVRQVTRHARKLGIPYLTLFAFSSLNWGRPSDEVKALMDLLCRFLISQESEMIADNNGAKMIINAGFSKETCLDEITFIAEKTQGNASPYCNRKNNPKQR